MLKLETLSEAMTENPEQTVAQFYNRVETTCIKYTTAYKVQSRQYKLPLLNSVILQLLKQKTLSQIYIYIYPQRH